MTLKGDSGKLFGMSKWLCACRLGRVWVKLGFKSGVKALADCVMKGFMRRCYGPLLALKGRMLPTRPCCAWNRAAIRTR
jgi:hypothetical protein